jgi:hypothetical protein
MHGVFSSGQVQRAAPETAGSVKGNSPLEQVFMLHEQSLGIKMSRPFSGSIPLVPPLSI